MKLLQITSAIVVLSISSRLAEGTPAAPPPRMIEVEAYFVWATPETIAKVTADAAASGGIYNEEQFSQILKALKGSDATIFANPRTVTISGQRGTISSVKELPYPSEYKRDEKSDKNYPISFDRRNIGVTFEFESVIGPNDLINILAQPEVTTFLGFIDFSNEVPPRDSSLSTLVKGALAEGGIWQPVISQFRVSTNLVLKSGQTTIMGGVAEEISPPTAIEKGTIRLPDERLIYIFVTARAIKES